MSGSTAPPPTPPETIRPRETIKRRGHRKLVLGAIGAVVVVILAGLGIGYELGYLFPRAHAAAGSCGTGVTLTGAGANFIGPLVSQWTASFQSQTGNLVSYSPAGAGAGISDLTQRTVDFAATDDPLNASQTEALPASVLTLPVTGGALAIVYNLPGTPSPIRLTGPLLAQIYLGQVTHWDDPALAAANPGVALPSNPIITVHRADAAGTTFVLTDFLSQDSPSWKSGPGKGILVQWPTWSLPQLAETGNSALAKYVQKNAYTIGYVDLTDVLLIPGLQYAKIQNPAGIYLLPTLADTEAAIANLSVRTTFPGSSADWGNVSMVNSPGTGDYPLSTLAYFFVYQALDRGYQPSLAKAKVLWQWLNWTVGPGQQYSADLYYVGLPPTVVSVTRAGLGTLTYAGVPLPVCH